MSSSIRFRIVGEAFRKKAIDIPNRAAACKGV